MTSLQNNTQIGEISKDGSRGLRLEYLDGLRGLAALYVLLFHLQMITVQNGAAGPIPALLVACTCWMQYGHYAVAVFIVLSGYCLMLPVVRSDDGALKGGLAGFLARRARRILPPYYAALFLSMLLIVAWDTLRHMAGARMHHVSSGAEYTWAGLISHVFMVHNLRNAWSLQIDSPMWSVATECDIYIIFALLLLPVWRRFGALGSLGLGLVLGLLPHFFFPTNNNLDWAGPWYLGLFAMGMAAADISERTRSTTALISRIPWAASASLLFACLAGMVFFETHQQRSAFSEGSLTWLNDIVMGASTAAFLVYCKKRAMECEAGSTPVALRLLESKPLLLAGSFSYSLYLVHLPVLDKLFWTLKMLHLNSMEVFFGMWLIGLPGILVVTYLFYGVAERPFLGRSRKSANVPEAQLASTLPSNNGKRVHLAYLDGLRGLAALYVVFYHVFQYQDGAAARYGQLDGWLLHFIGWLNFGKAAVCVFIVLSGYCLTIPVAKSAGKSLSGGILGFLKKRARRILPPYYAALALSLLVIAVVPGMNVISGRKWDPSLPAFTSGAVVSHLLMIQNLDGRWLWKINGTMWSVATECDIYILFALLILPIWRRFGLLASVAASCALGLCLPRLTHHHIDGAIPDFIGLFSFGMAAAAINFSDRPFSFLRADIRRLPWGSFSAVFFIVLCSGLALKGDWLVAHSSLFDAMVGLCAACLLVFCTNAAQTVEAPNFPVVLRFLGSRPLVTVGLFSYSLYLVHAPVLALVDLAFSASKLTALHMLVVMTGIGVPCSLIAAYLFHLAFEKRFMSAPDKTNSPFPSLLSKRLPAYVPLKVSTDLVAEPAQERVI